MFVVVIVEAVGAVQTVETVQAVVVLVGVFGPFGLPHAHEVFGPHPHVAVGLLLIGEILVVRPLIVDQPLQPLIGV